MPEAISNAYSAEFMERYGFRTVVHPLKKYAVGDIASTLWIPLGAVGLVLLNPLVRLGVMTQGGSRMR